MKKTLLFAALFAMAMSAKAQTFSVLHNGEEVQNGGIVICTEYEDETDEVPEDNYGYSYSVILTIKNDAMTSQNFTATLLWGNYPTQEEQMNDNDFVGDYGYTKWGDASICNTAGSCYGPNGDLNLGEGTVSIPGMTFNNGFLYHLMTAPTDLTSEYKTVIYPANNPEDKFECTIVYAPTEEAAKEYLANAAVDNIIAGEDAAPVYYNLNGMKVTNPSNGLYIVKRGAKVTKEIIR